MSGTGLSVLLSSSLLALTLASRDGFSIPGAIAPHASASTVSSPAPAAEAGEAILEGRLLAPCCYLQTLDVHESPLASALRLEVRARLRAGESQEAIEDDFALRYGERVRAVPKGTEPRIGIAYFTGLVLVVCGVGLGMLLRQWRRTDAPAPLPTSATRDALDARIDEELDDLDG